MLGGFRGFEGCAELGGVLRVKLSGLWGAWVWA